MGLHPARRRRLRGVVWVGLAGLVVLAVAGYVVAALVRAEPAATLVAAPLPRVFPGRSPRLAWPGQGQAAVGVLGVGLIGSHDSGRPTPIASIAKVMTAYLVLAAHPLRRGAGGPQIAVKPADVAVYQADVAAGDSVVAVRAGERLTERQALEALLLPSGNNIATLLARWDAGSERAFVARMNARAGALGLAHTHYTDASGVQPGTQSTAADQVRLAMLAIQVPVFRQIVAMRQVTLPVAGRQHNLDKLLGTDGIVGIKTGTTSQAGGCFVFAAHERLAGRSVTVVGAVLHQPATPAQPSLIAAAFHATTTLLASTRQRLVNRRVIPRGATLAWVKVPWTDQVPLQAASSASLIGWPGLPVHTTITPARHLTAPLTADQVLATAVIAADDQRDSVRLVTARPLPPASLVWRLTHP